jgi:hypothetical protein
MMWHGTFLKIPSYSCELVHPFTLLVSPICMIKCFPWDLNHKFFITLKLYGVRFVIIGHFGVNVFNNDGLGFP